VASKNEVTGLVNKNGFFYSSVDSVYHFAKPDEVEKELRAQIEKAKQSGIDFTHLDSHMGTLFANGEYLNVLLKLGREYKVPVMLNKPGFKMAFNVDIGNYVNEKDVLVDGIFMATPNDFKNGMDNYYSNVLKNVPSGLSEIIIHAANDDSEMQAICVDHPDWGAAWRQADVNFFKSDPCQKLLSDLNIRLITWREVRDKLIRQK
jgi:hypothetical protein